MNEPVAWVTVARLLRPQGRRGELLAELMTDFPERFESHPEVFLLAPGKEPSAATVESYWLPLGRNEGRVVLKLKGVDSINDAEQLAGVEVVIRPEQRVELPEDEEYVSDLIGCTILHGEDVLGVVDDVHFPADASGRTKLADVPALLVVRSPSGDEHLIPFAKAWIRRLDIAGKRIEMELPDGLLEING